MLSKISFINSVQGGKFGHSWSIDYVWIVENGIDNFLSKLFVNT